MTTMNDVLDAIGRIGNIHILGMQDVQRHKVSTVPTEAADKMCHVVGTERQLALAGQDVLPKTILNLNASAVGNKAFHLDESAFLTFHIGLDSEGRFLIHGKFGHAGDLTLIMENCPLATGQLHMIVRIIVEAFGGINATHCKWILTKDQGIDPMQEGFEGWREITGEICAELNSQADGIIIASTTQEPDFYKRTITDLMKEEPEMERIHVEDTKL